MVFKLVIVLFQLLQFVVQQFSGLFFLLKQIILSVTT